MRPSNLTLFVLEVALGLRPVTLQATMLVGVEQPVEVEASRPLVLGLEVRLGAVLAYPPCVLGELAVRYIRVLRTGVASKMLNR